MLVNLWRREPRIAGCLLRNKKEWVYSCYDKLASDLVFDNGRMMGTGFKPRHSLETILAADKRRLRRLDVSRKAQSRKDLN